jgi:alpha-L-fucosidase 2
LKKATGKNANSFYQTEEVPSPVVSPKASVTPPQLKETLMYDLPTQSGKVYTLIAE